MTSDLQLRMYRCSAFLRHALDLSWLPSSIVFISSQAIGRRPPTVPPPHSTSTTIFIYLYLSQSSSSLSLMMQSRREHGSSGELDVFGATSYFAGLALADDDACRRSSFRAVHDELLLGVVHDDDGGKRRHAQQAGQLVVANKQQPSGNKTSSKLAALLSFIVSPSPRGSFRKASPPPPTSRLQLAGAAGDEPGKRSPSPSSSSRERSGIMQLQQGCYGVLLHDLDDLGVAMGDRRLQGVRVVRGSGDEETWVVRCCSACWDGEQHHEKTTATTLVDAESSSSDRHGHKDEVDDEEGDGDDGNTAGNWESDSSSDLFDLDIDCILV
ncbi:hypothetical protein BS78_01G322800 [Paspalum vaginatum]|nr:hypothetical protein BS78_01G322800 [Paspalum vaginatum]